MKLFYAHLRSSVIDCKALVISLLLDLNVGQTALQIGDKHRVTTPVNWKKGEDVIVHPGVTNEEAKTLFPQHSQHLVSASITLFQGLLVDVIF